MLGRVFLGRYETGRLLGEGGMGCVYLARDLQGGRPVVVKLMHEHIAADPKFRERFQRETALMARLHHPNAVAFLGADEDDKHGPFLVMEYVKGEPLDKILTRAGQFRPPRLHRLLAQFCGVLQAAHDEHIVHCDLKPGNLMVVDFDSPQERLKVMDFGLARLSDAPAPGPAAGEGKAYAVGTPGYMPPEQVRGDAVDQRGDLYSVGVILYRLLTGRLPFAGETTMEILMAQASGPPPSFTDLGLADAIPAAVEDLVMACLDPDPAYRPQNARDLAAAYVEALAAAYGGPAEDPPPPDETLPPVPPPRRGKSLPLLRTAEPNAVVEEMEAWMPEQIAVYKLQGFVDAVSGELVETRPGLVRFRIGKAPAAPPKRSGLFSLLNLGSKPEPPTGCAIDGELHLRRDPASGRQGVLQVTLLLRPSRRNGKELHPDYHARCHDVQRMLRSFLMVRNPG